MKKCKYIGKGGGWRFYIILPNSGMLISYRHRHFFWYNKRRVMKGTIYCQRNSRDPKWTFPKDAAREVSRVVSTGAIIARVWSRTRHKTTGCWPANRSASSHRFVTRVSRERNSRRRLPRKQKCGRHGRDHIWPISLCVVRDDIRAHLFSPDLPIPGRQTEISLEHPSPSPSLPRVPIQLRLHYLEC